MTTDSTWDELQQGQYQRPYRWAPVETARLESLLVRMEEAALFQPKQIERLRVQAESLRLNRTKPVLDFDVSLIEDSLRHRYFHGRSKWDELDRTAETLRQKLQADPQLVAQIWNKRSPESPGTDSVVIEPDWDALSEKERAYLVWKIYEQVAASEDSQLLGLFFRREAVRLALETVGTHTKWIETYLLHRIASDVPWAVRDEDRLQACGSAVLAFSKLQRLASHPEPRLGWWLAKSLESVEAEFLLAFDLALAGRSRESIEKSSVCLRSLDPLDAAAQDLEALLDSLDRACRELPQHVAWILKEYQFTEAGQLATLQQLLVLAGESANLTHELTRTLEKPATFPIDEVALGIARKLQGKLSELNSAFLNFINSKTSYRQTGAASLSAKTFRRERLALQSTLLPADIRKALQSRCRAYLEAFQPEEAIAKPDEVLPNRDVQTAFQTHFLPQLASESNFWRTLLLKDGRRNLKNLFPSAEALRVKIVEDLDQMEQRRARLVNLDAKSRLLAHVRGNAPSFLTWLRSQKETNELPWSASEQLVGLSQINYSRTQMQRLARAAWGNGPFSTDSLPAEFLFSKWTSSYKLPVQVAAFPQLASLPGLYQTEQNTLLSDATARILSVQFQVGNAQQTVALKEIQDSKVAVSSELRWAAIAQVLLGNTDRRLAWEKNDYAPVVASLAEADPVETWKAFDTRYWAGEGTFPQATLLVRGHQRTLDLNWKRVSPAEEQPIELENRSRSIAEIHFQKPQDLPRVSVLLLVDCSDSMNLRVSTRTEGGIQMENVFQSVKQCAREVIEKFSEMQGVEAEIEIAIVPFGNKPDGKLNEFLYYQVPNRKLPSAVKPGALQTLNSDWKADIENTLEDLQSGGDTPLYFAIETGLDRLQLSKNSGLVYVFSDGVNSINHDKLKSQDSYRRIQSLLDENNQIKLNIFHFDYFTRWLREEKKTWDVDPDGIRYTTEDIQRAEKIFTDEYVRGTQELRDLAQLPNCSYEASNNFARLLSLSIDSIPRSTATVQSLNSPTDPPYLKDEISLSDKLTVDAVHLPSDFLATILDTRGDKTTSKFELLGGETLSLQFDPAKRKVLFPEFRPAGKEKQQTDQRSRGLTSALYVGTNTEFLHQGSLGFEMSFWNGSREQFTSRPRLLIAEVQPLGQPKDWPTILADHYFSSTHYPEAQFSNVPWPEGRTPVRMRVWAADALPPSIDEVTCKADQTDSFQKGEAKIEVRHSGDQVQVKVEYPASLERRDRVVVQLPSFRSAKRYYQLGQLQERHEFELDPKRTGPIILRFTTIGELEKLAKSGQVAQLEFPSIELPD